MKRLNEAGAYDVLEALVFLGLFVGVPFGLAVWALVDKLRGLW